MSRSDEEPSYGFLRIAFLIRLSARADRPCQREDRSGGMVLPPLLSEIGEISQMGYQDVEFRDRLLAARVTEAGAGHRRAGPQRLELSLPRPLQPGLAVRPLSQRQAVVSSYGLS